MATDKQIAANRLNCQNSTGPKTPEGQLKAIRNNIRYTRLAQSILLQSENPGHFIAFARRFYLEWKPKGPTERTLLDTMISARWRLIRAQNLEATGIDSEYQSLRFEADSVDTVPVRTSLAFSNAIGKSRAIEILNRTESRLQRQFDSAFDRLNRLRLAREAAENLQNSLIPEANL